MRSIVSLKEAKKKNPSWWKNNKQQWSFILSDKETAARCSERREGGEWCSVPTFADVEFALTPWPGVARAEEEGKAQNS